jgi:hypothetical protein
MRCTRDDHPLGLQLLRDVLIPFCLERMPDRLPTSLGIPIRVHNEPEALYSGCPQFREERLEQPGHSGLRDYVKNLGDVVSLA